MSDYDSEADHSVNLWAAGHIHHEIRFSCELKTNGSQVCLLTTGTDLTRSWTKLSVV